MPKTKAKTVRNSASRKRGGLFKAEDMMRNGKNHPSNNIIEITKAA
jgi:hypothetical protein